MEYSAGLTSKLFWLQESRKTAEYILKDIVRPIFGKLSGRRISIR